MLAELKKLVFNANKLLPSYGLVTLTWGNVSGIDRDKGLIVIKPSGVEYEHMSWQQMVVTDMDGNIVEGDLRPSSDTPTHCILYKNFPEIGGVVHTHSSYATAFAQACKPVSAYGTTHADYFYGDVPITRDMLPNEIKDNYEEETGNVIVETFQKFSINPQDMPGVLVRSHGPFSWGKDPLNAVENAVVLEEVAKMAYFTNLINPSVTKMDKNLLDKHFLRKHGANAYYGQVKK